MIAAAKELRSPKDSLHCQLEGVGADARSVAVKQSVFMGEGAGHATKLYDGFKPE